SDELLSRIRLGLAELRLHLGSPAQTAVDLDVAQLGVHAVAAPQPEGHEGEDEPDPGSSAAEEGWGRPEVEGARRPAGNRRGRRDDADDHEAKGDPGEWPPGRLGRHLERDRDLAR